MMQRIDRYALCRSLVICLLMAGLAMASDTKTTNPRTFEFVADGVTFDADFEGTRLNDVVRESAGTYQIVIRS